MIKEVTQIDGPILTAQEATGDTLALQMFTLIVSRVGFIIRFPASFAGVQAAVERFLLANPELETTSIVLGFARESDLRFAPLQLLHNGPVGHITHLEVLLDRNTLLVTHSSFTFGHQSIAGIVSFADVAVDTLPAVLALASIGVTLRSVVAIGQRATQRYRAVVASVSRRTGAFSVVAVAFCEMGAVVVVELAVEASWTLGASGRPITEEGNGLCSERDVGEFAVPC